MADLTPERLRELLHYDPETGVFTWRQARSGVVVGQVAGRRSTQGYWTIPIYRKIYKAHRLAWLYVYGEWPVKFLDHVNRVRDDNRIANLREVTNKENCNNHMRPPGKSGVVGVYVDKRTGHYRVEVSSRYIGMFDTLSEAVAARRAAEITEGIAHVVPPERYTTIN